MRFKYHNIREPGVVLGGIQMPPPPRCWLFGLVLGWERLSSGGKERQAEATAQDDWMELVQNAGGSTDFFCFVTGNLGTEWFQRVAI